MNTDSVVVYNTDSKEIGEIRRTLFESDVFNPGGLLLVEVEDTRSGCVDCGVDPSNVRGEGAELVMDHPDVTEDDAEPLFDELD